MDVWFESLDDAGNEVQAILARSARRTRWEMARVADREANERMQTGGGPTPKNTNGTVNPATGLWYSYSVPGMRASMSGTDFHPMVK